MNQLIKTILSNRYAVLLTTLTAYLLVVVAEGAITGREARLLDFENLFSISISGILKNSKPPDLGKIQKSCERPTGSELTQHSLTRGLPR